MAFEDSESEETPVASAASIEALASRSMIYAVLAQGFGYPSEDSLEALRRCPGTAPETGREAESLIGSLRDSAASFTAEDIGEAYMRLFDPVTGPFPYESENRQLHDFAKAHLMADVMGFYRAFGVEPRNERPDHIATELEFMHYLALKECHALSQGQPDNASLCRDARQKFFREHLATWTDALLASMRARRSGNENPFYENLMNLLEVTISLEQEDLT